jgi:hypothetical protein
MTPPLGLLGYGGAIVIVFDAVASVASRTFDFPYTRAAIGSNIIYAVVGYFAARFDGWRAAAAIGAALGLVDATLGWYISTVLRANTPPMPSLTFGLWVGVAITVMITGAISALIGAAVWRVVAKREAPAA